MYTSPLHALPQVCGAAELLAADAAPQHHYTQNASQSGAAAALPALRKALM